MPAHTFGKHLACWKQGGRKKCQKDSYFQKMESDVQNIVPTIGQINRDRRNYATRLRPARALELMAEKEARDGD